MNSLPASVRILLLFLLSVISCAHCFSQATPPGNDWVWQQINVGKAAMSFKPVRKVKVAIVDGAFDLDHPLIKKYVDTNSHEIPDNNIDDDHNGLVDDVSGWDFADNDHDVRPRVSDYSAALHGTRIADMFLQTVDKLIPGSEHFVTILPVKAAADDDGRYLLHGYKAIDYAIQQHADVILCSWAGIKTNEEEKRILQKATDAGIAVVAAAGNYYFTELQYPGAYGPVLCVAGVDKKKQRLNISDYGPYVDIAAPGDSILSISNKTTTRNTYERGTSFAVPIVGGVVAAILATGYDGGVMGIDHLLKNSADAVDSSNPVYAGKLGAGEINVAALRNLMEAETSTVFRQPKGYIETVRLTADQPVVIKAAGRFRDYKLMMLPEPQYHGKPIMVKYFKDGLMSEREYEKAALSRPVYIDADSIYIYGSPGRKKNTGGQYWYYEAETIDSSTLYCSGTTEIRDTEGYIEDGSGASNYTGRNNCKWLIIAPPGKKIAIDFVEFDTEPKKDELYVFNGAETNEQILGIFSGHNLPPRLKTGGNVALVWFLTNDDIQFKGWKLHYKVVDQ